MNQLLTLRQEPAISFVWNGRNYSYTEKGIALVEEAAVNGLLRRRVLAHKRHARGGPAFVGKVVGAVTLPNREKYQSVIYLVEREKDGKILQSVRISSIE